MLRSVFLSAAVLTLLLTQDAGAHALLDHAEPRVGNKVASPPREVMLWFTQNVEGAFSGITVTNAAGERVDTGKARVNGNQMAVSLRSGGPSTLPCNVARGFGRYPHDRRQLQLPGRPLGEAQGPSHGLVWC